VIYLKLSRFECWPIEVQKRQRKSPLRLCTRLKQRPKDETCVVEDLNLDLESTISLIPSVVVQQMPPFALDPLYCDLTMANYKEANLYTLLDAVYLPGNSSANATTSE
jgi:hypothetical protein